MPSPRVVIIPKPLDALPTYRGAVPSDPASRAIADRIALAQAEHARSIAILRRTAPADACWLSAPDPALLAKASLVVTLGGDGTFLTAARHVTDALMLGVNSSPETSVGHYCAATAETAAHHIDAILSRAASPTPLTRIQARIDDAPLPYFALNDVLFANRTPVSSTRYALCLPSADGTRQPELQLSSGIWIATATGSTAAIRSAGGEVVAPHDPRLQWRVREPFVHPAAPWSLLSGFTTTAIEIVSRSDHNALYLDGHNHPWPVPVGAKATLTRAPDPLWAVLPDPPPSKSL